MKIVCQSCQSKYNVADEKVQGKIVKIRCRKCGATIVVNATASAAAANGSVPAPAPAIASATAPRGGDASAGDAASGGAAEWHVSISDNDQRTMTLAELVNAYNTGVVVADTFVWTEGMQDWKALSEVEAIVSALHAAASEAPPAATASKAPPAATASDAPPAATAVGGYAYAAPAPAATASPTYEAPVARRAYEQTAAYSAGLGVHAAIAGPAPEPKRAAVVRREARARDLFATRASEEVQAAAAAPEAVDNNLLTGQRNENSVLFSLDHLTKSAEARPAASSTTTTEDSGIIDLKALAAKAESMRPPTMHEINVGVPPLGLAPAQYAPALGGFAPLGAEAPPPRSRLPLLIGAGAGIALLLVLGIVIGLKIGGAVAPPPLATAVAASAFPIPSVTATADPNASASASASAQPSASAPVATKPRPYYGGGAMHKPQGGGAGAGAAAGGAGASAATTGAAGTGGTQTAAPPKKNDCGCNGDLMCMMKCSTHQ
jgi:predicted Zn finger-like uncharacterized protein